MRGIFLIIVLFAFTICTSAMVQMRLKRQTETAAEGLLQKLLDMPRFRNFNPLEKNRVDIHLHLDRNTHRQWDIYWVTYKFLLLVGREPALDPRYLITLYNGTNDYAGLIHTFRDSKQVPRLLKSLRDFSDYKPRKFVQRLDYDPEWDQGAKAGASIILVGPEVNPRLFKTSVMAFIIPQSNLLKNEAEYKRQIEEQRFDVIRDPNADEIVGCFSNPDKCPVVKSQIDIPTTPAPTVPKCAEITTPLTTTKRTTTTKKTTTATTTAKPRTTTSRKPTTTSKTKPPTTTTTQTTTTTTTTVLKPKLGEVNDKRCPFDVVLLLNRGSPKYYDVYWLAYKIIFDLRSLKLRKLRLSIVSYSGQNAEELFKLSEPQNSLWDRLRALSKFRNKPKRSSALLFPLSARRKALVHIDGEKVSVMPLLEERLPPLDEILSDSGKFQVESRDSSTIIRLIYGYCNLL